jgi:hypothetical protein
MSKRTHPGTEVFGANVRLILDAFGHFKSVASKILLQHGMGKRGAGGLVEVEPEAWYPLDNNIAAMREIGVRGDAVLYQAGKLIPKHFPFPAQITDVSSALKMLDVAYHMNHRLGGEVMFNPATGKMLDGIGHYRYEPGSRPDEGTMVCDNPYPCGLDRGLVTGVANRYGSRVTVEHARSGCRARDDASCIYHVTWTA